MGRTVRKMALDAAQAIELYKIKNIDVLGLDIYQSSTHPTVRLTPIGFERCFESWESRLGKCNATTRRRCITLSSRIAASSFAAGSSGNPSRSSTC